MMYWLFFIIIIFEAVADGLMKQNNKVWSKRLEHFSIVLFFLMFPFTTVTINPISEFKWYYIRESLEYPIILIIQYVTIRWYLFDFINSKTAGWAANFVGTTSPLYDNLLGRLKNWQFWVFKSVGLIASLFWYFVVLLKY